MPRPIKFKKVKYRRSDLVMGFKADKVAFMYTDFKDRVPAAQRAYEELKADLLENGMKEPLITFRGHILLGIRRFEILRDRQTWFSCYEIEEDVYHWDRDDIDRLEVFKKLMYGDTPEFMG